MIILAICIVTLLYFYAINIIIIIIIYWTWDFTTRVDPASVATASSTGNARNATLFVTWTFAEEISDLTANGNKQNAIHKHLRKHTLASYVRFLYKIYIYFTTAYISFIYIYLQHIYCITLINEKLYLSFFSFICIFVL